MLVNRSACPCREAVGRVDPRRVADPGPRTAPPGLHHCHTPEAGRRELRRRQTTSPPPRRTSPGCRSRAARGCRSRECSTIHRPRRSVARRVPSRQWRRVRQACRSRGLQRAGVPTTGFGVCSGGGAGGAVRGPGSDDAGRGSTRPTPRRQGHRRLFTSISATSTRGCGPRSPPAGVGKSKPTHGRGWAFARPITINHTASQIRREQHRPKQPVKSPAAGRPSPAAPARPRRTPGEPARSSDLL